MKKETMFTLLSAAVIACILALVLRATVLIIKGGSPLAIVVDILSIAALTFYLWKLSKVYF